MQIYWVKLLTFDLFAIHQRFLMSLNIGWIKTSYLSYVYGVCFKVLIQLGACTNIK